jgi:hypothetical protein
LCFLKGLDGTTYIQETPFIMLARDKLDGTELIIEVNVLTVLEKVLGCL